jgi:hypothetical protein
LLSFPFIYFFKTGLINRLRPIQIKKSISFRRTRRGCKTRRNTHLVDGRLGPSTALPPVLITAAVYPYFLFWAIKCWLALEFHFQPGRDGRIRGSGTVRRDALAQPHKRFDAIGRARPLRSGLIAGLGRLPGGVSDTRTEMRGESRS